MGGKKGSATGVQEAAVQPVGTQHWAVEQAKTVRAGMKPELRGGGGAG